MTGDSPRLAVIVPPAPRKGEGEYGGRGPMLCGKYGLKAWAGYGFLRIGVLTYSNNEGPGALWLRNGGICRY